MNLCEITTLNQNLPTPDYNFDNESYDQGIKTLINRRFEVIYFSTKLIIVLLIVGVIFRKLKQPWAEKVGKAIKPVALLFLAFLLTFGLYTNRYGNTYFYFILYKKFNYQTYR